MKRNVYLLGSVAIIFLIILSGCGKTPADTVKTFYKLGNNGNYSEAEKYLSSENLNEINGVLGALMGGFKGIMDKATHNGTIKRIEILKEKIRGKRATVYYIFHYKNGKTLRDKELLIKVNGKWKITN